MAIKELMHDTFFLALKSEKATKDDLHIANDLLETLKYHKETCVGMAANMIGERKNIICFVDGKNYVTMFNPVIIKKSGEYDAEETCLSLIGEPKKTKRYKTITVEFETEKFVKKIKKYENFTAQIIQHEIDHLNGVLI